MNNSDDQIGSQEERDRLERLMAIHELGMRPFIEARHAHIRDLRARWQRCAGDAVHLRDAHILLDDEKVDQCIVTCLMELCKSRAEPKQVIDGGQIALLGVPG